MNKVWITGRLTKKPELKKVNDNCVCKFDLAVNSPIVRDGERQTDFISCVVWNTLAENLCKYQDKGSLIGVEGRIQTRNYESNGIKKYITEIAVNNIEFFEKKDMPLDQLTTKTDFDKTGQIEISEEDYPF